MNLKASALKKSHLDVGAAGGHALMVGYSMGTSLVPFPSTPCSHPMLSMKSQRFCSKFLSVWAQIPNREPFCAERAFKQQLKPHHPSHIQVR